MQNSGIEHKSNTANGQAGFSRQTLQPKETAQYIADMVLELRNMAKASELTALRNLLELCFYEAFSAANKVVLPSGEIEQLRKMSEAANAAG
jgi:hypothetical protein